VSVARRRGRSRLSARRLVAAAVGAWIAGWTIVPFVHQLPAAIVNGQDWAAISPALGALGPGWEAGPVPAFTPYQVVDGRAVRTWIWSAGRTSELRVGARWRSVDLLLGYGGCAAAGPSEVVTVHQAGHVLARLVVRRAFAWYHVDLSPRARGAPLTLRYRCVPRSRRHPGVPATIALAGLRHEPS
jgi:hypothetical protein